MRAQFENEVTFTHAEIVYSVTLSKTPAGILRYWDEAELSWRALFKRPVTQAGLFTVAPSSLNPQTQLASRYAITMTAKIELRDVRENKVLWENPSVVFRQEYEATAGRSATDPAAFFQQDTDSLERMSTDFARTIVSAILEAF